MLVLSGCGSVSTDVLSEQLTLFEYTTGGGQKLFFSYPVEGKLELNGGMGKLAYSGCEVIFGEGQPEESFPDLKLEEKSENGINYKSMFEPQLDELKVYMAAVSNLYFYEKNHAGSCVDLVNHLVDSVSDKPKFISNRYNFSLNLLPDYKFDYLPGEEGVVMKKWVEFEKPANFEYLKDTEKLAFENYRVEIGIKTVQNAENFADAAELVRSKFPGYSIETNSFSDVNGLIVTESDDLKAARHFFVFGVDKGVYFDLYMEVPGYKYSEYQKDYENFLKSFAFFE